MFDRSNVKDSFVLRALSGAPVQLQEAFENQAAVLDEVIEAEGDPAKLPNGYTVSFASALPVI